MKSYACKSDVFKGDIVTVKEDIYIDYPGGIYKDHFVTKNKHYIVIDDMNSNNGNFRAKDSHGIMTWLNTMNIDRIDKRKNITNQY